LTIYLPKFSEEKSKEVNPTSAGKGVFKEVGGLIF